MIRLLIALIIVALLLTKVSEMFSERETTSVSGEPSAPEDTMIGGAYEPYTRAQQFSDKYPDALDQQREELDKKIDGG